MRGKCKSNLSFSIKHTRFSNKIGENPFSIYIQEKRNYQNEEDNLDINRIICNWASFNCEALENLMLESCISDNGLSQNFTKRHQQSH